MVDQSEKEILEFISLEYEDLSWKEGIFHFELHLYRIDTSTRHNGLWRIQRLFLGSNEDGELHVDSIIIFPPSLFTCEAICHAFGLNYYENTNECYPQAGCLGNVKENLFINFDVNECTINEDDDQLFIFSSYCHLDKQIVYDEVDWIRNIGYEVWDDREIPGACKWEKILPEKIEECALFIVFISKNSIHSENVAREISYAIKQKRVSGILPVYLEPVILPKELDFNLGPIQSIMKYKLSHESYQKKLREVLTRIEQNYNDTPRVQDLSFNTRQVSRI